MTIGSSTELASSAEHDGCGGTDKEGHGNMGRPGPRKSPNHFPLKPKQISPWEKTMHENSVRRQ